ncbi:hypothetical protein F2Q69_00038144 [Brassica cretica]|uniref:Jacalin-type lectin domain-containing protein n=1 Tax=Brassica cretica TaxID=69181 RepID=A0A8S9SDF0_BRACR|nr:hypothetical protein F2Q69_00038144 [Brassica cretica]
MDAPERFCMLLVRYFVTTTTPLTPAKKLPAVGGDGGIAWDDGAYDGVRKVFVGQAQDGISVVNLYLTIRVSTSRRYHRSDSEVVTMLRFKTNKQTSAPFGIEAGTQRVKFQDLRTDSSVWSPCLSNH